MIGVPVLARQTRKGQLKWTEESIEMRTHAVGTGSFSVKILNSVD